MRLASQPMIEARPEHDPLFGFVHRIWRGECSLGPVFWLYGVLGSALLSVLFLFTRDHEGVTGQQALLGILALYTIWVIGSIWRSAKRAEVDHLHASARAFTVAWTINAVLLLGFFEVDLLARLFS